MLLKYIAYDILTDLNAIYDDRKIELPQAVYWISVVGNRLKAKHIGATGANSGAFLSTYSDINVITQTTNTNPDIVKNRKYFVLPKTIYDFNDDRGINYIAYTSNGLDPKCPPRFTKVTFTRTTPKGAMRLYMNPHEIPSPHNPYFYRTGDNIYLLGIEEIPDVDLEIGIHQSFDPIQTIDIDSEFDFPDELLAQLKREVLDLGSFIFQIPQERINDGSAILAGQVPSKKLVSVNQQNNQ